MGTPFSFNGALNLTPDTALPQDPIPFNGAAAFDSKADYEFTFTGAGTQVVPFATVAPAGAKLVAVRVESTVGAAPVLFKFNGGTELTEVSPGGFYVKFSPVPAAGTTAMSFEYTASGKVKVWLLG